MKNFLLSRAACGCTTASGSPDSLSEGEVPAPSLEGLFRVPEAVVQSQAARESLEGPPRKHAQMLMIIFVSPDQC